MDRNGNTLSMAGSRLEDHLEIGPQEDFSIGQFCGDWVSTNSSTRGIARVIIEMEGDGLRVHAFGAEDIGPNDWGAVAGKVFTDGAWSTRIRAFSSVYDFGFMETNLQAKTEKGVLVIASFNRFKDQSGRANYFSREFFYRQSN